MSETGFRGRRALVCGSTRGIGRATAERLASGGAEVVLMARDEGRLGEVLSGLAKVHGQEHGILVADFSSPEDVGGAARNHLDRTGKSFHVLINNTGGPPGGPLLDADADALTKPFRQHVLASQQLAQAVVPGMREQRHGRIINIISTSVKAPLRGLGVSNTIRAAMANWAKTLATELAADGITVNNVLPGATLTDRLRSIISARAERSGKSEDEVQQAMIAEIPAGRFASAEELAAAVAFLASDEAGYITGINLPVDGGRLPCL